MKHSNQNFFHFCEHQVSQMISIAQNIFQLQERSFQDALLHIVATASDDDQTPKAAFAINNYTYLYTEYTLRCSCFSLIPSQLSQHAALRAQTQSMFSACGASRSDLVNVFRMQRFALRPSQRFQLAALRAQTQSTFSARSASRSDLVNVFSSQLAALRARTCGGGLLLTWFYMLFAFVNYAICSVSVLLL